MAGWMIVSRSHSSLTFWFLHRANSSHLLPFKVWLISGDYAGIQWLRRYYTISKLIFFCFFQSLSTNSTKRTKFMKEKIRNNKFFMGFSTVRKTKRTNTTEREKKKERRNKKKWTVLQIRKLLEYLHMNRTKWNKMLQKWVNQKQNIDQRTMVRAAPKPSRPDQSVSLLLLLCLALWAKQQQQQQHRESFVYQTFW